MGPYPFGNLGIQPKMRSGRRFENQNQRLQPCTAPNCKNQFPEGGGGKLPNRPWKMVNYAPDLLKKLGQIPNVARGHYPFGIFKI